MDNPPESLRIYPESWTEPCDFRTRFAHPERPFEIDVGCGKGRFLLARARRHPDIHYLGIERLLGRIRKLDAKALRAGVTNLCLLRLDAFYAVSYLVPADCVKVYYIFFPDPWPKTRHHQHRLMCEDFVDALHRTLVPDGVFHFATDHLPYFDKVAAMLARDSRWSPIDPLVPDEEEQTDFERIYVQQRPIGRASFIKTPVHGDES